MADHDSDGLQRSNYDRQPFRVDPVVALDLLHARLVEEAMSYESAAIATQRDAVYVSIAAVHEFLTGQGFSAPTLAPLSRALEALAAVEQGNVDEAFCPSRAGGRPSKSLPLMLRHGVLAALAEQWLKINKGSPHRQTILLASAAREMKGPWFGNITGGQLKKYREIAMQSGPEDPTRMRYEQALRAMEMFAAKLGSGEKAFHRMIAFQNEMPDEQSAGERAIPETPLINGSD